MLLVAGPCILENEKTPLEIAQTVSEYCQRLGIQYIFKASWKKANRTRLDSFTGLPFSESMALFDFIRKTAGVKIITDIHECVEVEKVAPHVDFLQIPAFLSRQTDLLLEAGRTGLPIHIKKGQFAGPESMKFAIEKVFSTGNNRVTLVERGTTFGYQDLIVDFRSVPLMQKLGVPVIVDCTHSLQKPNQTGGVTGGDPTMIETIARAAMAVGADGLFIETHPRPAEALSDGANMLPLDKLYSVLNICKKISEIIEMK